MKAGSDQKGARPWRPWPPNGRALETCGTDGLGQTLRDAGRCLAGPGRWGGHLRVPAFAWKGFAWEIARAGGSGAKRRRERH